jgi:ubiquinone/menaquinone biosynthesis C-methylase UbiE
LAQKGRRVFGLDFSLERLRHSKGKYSDLVAGDAMHLPFRNKCFDVLWSSELLEHLGSLNVFDEIERVTKKMILVTVPNPKGPYYNMDSSHILSYDVDSLGEFLNVRSWHYKIEGLGLCFPFYFPEMLRRLFLYLSRHRPGLAFNILIKGLAQIS